ncbi:MAG: transcriptional repressor [Elusimicrobia bacterium]|nr:transcriptional repressor [Elusimicrobiota bacterium]
MPSQELRFRPGRADYVQRVRAVFAEELARRGLRLTAQRERILGFLLAAQRHVSLDEIRAALKESGLGRATVFRTLRVLMDSGLVSRVSDPQGAARYEVDLERPHHDHLICTSCGSIEEVRWPELERIQHRVCERAGFTAQWHRHEIYGRCRRCRGKG